MWLFPCYHKSCARYVFFFWGGGFENAWKIYESSKTVFVVFRVTVFGYLFSGAFHHPMVDLCAIQSLRHWQCCRRASGPRFVNFCEHICFFDSSVNVFACASPVFCSVQLVGDANEWRREGSPAVWVLELFFPIMPKKCSQGRWPKKWKISSKKKVKKLLVELKCPFAKKSGDKTFAQNLGQSAWWLGPFLAEVVGHGRVVVQQWLRVGPQGLRFDDKWRHFGLRFDKKRLIFVRIVVDPGSNLRFVYIQSSHFKVEYVVNGTHLQSDTILRNSLKVQYIYIYMYMLVEQFC